jgi:hypothetical protein
VCYGRIHGGVSGVVLPNARAQLEVHLVVHPRSGNSQAPLPGEQRGTAAAIFEPQLAVRGGLRDGYHAGMSQPRKTSAVARWAKPEDVSRDLTISRMNSQMANDSACHK